MIQIYGEGISIHLLVNTSIMESPTVSHRVIFWKILQIACLHPNKIIYLDGWLPARQNVKRKSITLSRKLTLTGLIFIAAQLYEMEQFFGLMYVSDEEQVNLKEINYLTRLNLFGSASVRENITFKIHNEQSDTLEKLPVLAI